VTSRPAVKREQWSSPVTTTAIVMMIVAMATIWGGLVFSTRFLLTHPLPPDAPGADAAREGGTQTS